MNLLQVLPGSQSPRRSLGFLVQMKALLIRAKTEDRTHITPVSITLWLLKSSLQVDFHLENNSFSAMFTFHQVSNECFNKSTCAEQKSADRKAVKQRILHRATPQHV